MSAASLTLGRASYPLILPSIRDPRLHVAAVIISIHVLGQVGLHFVVSVPQILAAILTCAALEIVITFWQRKAVVWPASAMLTGSGVALILRVVGTPAADHWSVFAIGVYAAVAGLSLLSKYVIRFRGSPLFNPSNVGLVATFILLGPARVEPLDFWWAPPNFWLGLAYVAIVSGGLLITRRLHLMSLAVAFWATLAIGVGVVAISGHCMIANWAFAPVCGFDLWRVIVTSPEVLIFLFFMITDPRTVPAGRLARVGFGVLVALLGTLLLATQDTEFGAKVGLLSGLTLMCAARPLLDRFVPESASVEVSARQHLAGLMGLTRGTSPRIAVVRCAYLVVAVAAIVSGMALAGARTRDVAVSDARMTLDPARFDPHTFPAITIDDAVTDWDPTLSSSAIQGILLTAAQNLEIENEALLQTDSSLLFNVDHGDRLEEMQERIRDAVSAGMTRIDHYQPEIVEVSLLRPFGRQDGLSLALKARGVKQADTYDASGRLQTRATSPFSLTFVVRRATGDRWLNVAVLPNESDGTIAQ